MIAAIQNHTSFLHPVRQWTQDHPTISKIIQVATVIFSAWLLFTAPATGVATFAGALVLQMGCVQAVQAVKPVDPEMKERILGAFYGQFVGDAIGVTTEFMDRASAQKVIRLGPLEYSTRYATEAFKAIERGNVQDRYQWRLNFPFGGWTDDSDQAMCIVRALRSNRAPDKAFAEELMNWIRNGLSGRDFSAQEGGREGRGSGPRALGLGTLVGAVIGVNPNNPAHQAAFLRNPKERATAV